MKPPRVAANDSTADASAAALVLGVLRTLVRDAVREAVQEMKTELQVTAPTRTGDPRADGELLSVNDVAKRIGVMPATIREWIKTGYLPAVALGPAGRRYGIRHEDVDALVNKQEKKGEAMDIDKAAIQIVRSSRAHPRRGKE